MIKSINEFFKNAVIRTVTPFTEGDARVYYFFAGDFNARTGSNMVGITDDNFYKKENNKVYAEFNKCHSQQDFRFTDSIKRSSVQKKLEITNINQQKTNCYTFHDKFIEKDEYKEFFDQYPIIKNSLSCANSNLKANLISFSRIHEKKIEFMPSFCFKKADKKYGFVHKKEITSYTDRIFYSTQIRTDRVSNGGFPLIKPISYDADVMNYWSDHAMVYGSFQLSQGLSNNLRILQVFPIKMNH